MTPNDAEAGRTLSGVSEARVRLESLAAMALGVAHELNNNAACVIANSDVMRKLLTADSPLSENAAEMRQAGREAAQLAEELMLFTGRVRPHRVPVILADLTRELVARYRPLADPGARLSLGATDAHPPLRADLAQMARVVGNLIQNALDFAGARANAITVSSGTADFAAVAGESEWPGDAPPAGPCACVEVADRGRGLSPEGMARMFEPFFTTKMRGRGMGLAVAYGIVRAHGGAIRARPGPSGGAVFRVLLPCPAA